MINFIMVKDLFEFFVCKFGRHPFYDESLTFGLVLVGFGQRNFKVLVLLTEQCNTF